MPGASEEPGYQLQYADFRSRLPHWFRHLFILLRHMTSFTDVIFRFAISPVFRDRACLPPLPVIARLIIAESPCPRFMAIDEPPAAFDTAFGIEPAIVVTERSLNAAADADTLIPV